VNGGITTVEFKYVVPLSPRQSDRVIGFLFPSCGCVDFHDEFVAWHVNCSESVAKKRPTLASRYANRHAYGHVVSPPSCPDSHDRAYFDTDLQPVPSF
jgi:hypothetical protein